MNTRLSVSTVTYLAEQEKLAQEERAREFNEKIESEKRRREQAELFNIKGTLPYSDLIAQEICERISCGELLINICLDEHLPTMRHHAVVA
jgi:hypothetical protein